MKQVQVTALLMGALVAGQTVRAEVIQISATKKTADKRTSSAQQAPRGTTQMSLKSQFYRFDYRPMTPNLPTQATLEYGVLQENFDGRLEEAVRGETDVDLTFGQTQSVESDSFELNEREWQHRKGGTGSIKQDVYGVGIRILDSQDEVLAEKYIPASKQKELEEALNRQPRQAVEPPAKAGNFSRRHMGKKGFRAPLRKP